MFVKTKLAQLQWIVGNNLDKITELQSINLINNKGYSVILSNALLLDYESSRGDKHPKTFLKQGLRVLTGGEQRNAGELKPKYRDRW